jgi:hypothetical protein
MLRQFDMFYAHLVLCGLGVYFPPVWYVLPRKILQPCLPYQKLLEFVKWTLGCRVTRWVCEKIAQPIFLSKSIQNYYRGKRQHQILGSFLNFLQAAQKNTHPISENSPNLVTLLSCDMLDKTAEKFWHFYVKKNIIINHFITIAFLFSVKR